MVPGTVFRLKIDSNASILYKCTVHIIHPPQHSLLKSLRSLNYLHCSVDFFLWHSDFLVMIISLLFAANVDSLLVTMTGTANVHHAPWLMLPVGLCRTELAESWDSCVRFSCLRHGATVHTSFELVPPFPEFEPRLSLRRRGAVVINTGSFLHVVTVGLAAPLAAEPPPGTEFPDDASCAGSDQLSLASLEVDVSCEEPLPLAARGALPWRFDPRSPRAEEPRLRSPRAEEPRRQMGWRPPEPAERAASPAERRPRPWPRRLPAARQANMSADEYEFSEDGSDAHRENFSIFRRKRLADKKYEFSDENSENVPRFFSAARPAAGAAAGPCLVPVSEALLSPAGGINSKRRLPEEEDKTAAARSSTDGDVLRAISCNTEPELFFSTESDCESEASLLTASPRPPDRSARPAVVPGSPPSPAACCVHLSRRYVEVDDELVSVATDIEEDDLSRSTGYHYALPLEVHGAGYAQMQMVSGSRADKLPLPSLTVSQLSLDMEQLCHKISQSLCAEAGKKYWFCNDYDVELVEVSPDSGDVTVVAVVLVQAAVRTRGLSKSTRRPLSSVHRHQYRASFTFSWSTETGQYRLLTSEPLTEVTDRRDLQPAGGGPRWQPARLLAASLRHPRPLPQAPYSAVKVLTNEPALTGERTRHRREPDHLCYVDVSLSASSKLQHGRGASETGNFDRLEDIVSTFNTLLFNLN